MENFLAVNKEYLGMGLKSIDILIISQIEEYKRNECDCYITNEQFANMFGDSRETIKRSLTKLENMGIISRKTKFIEGNGRANRQRVLSLNKRNKWKAHSEPTKDAMEGSNIDNGRLKSQEWKAHSEPIKEKEKEKEKENKLAALGVANAIEDKWIPKDDSSKEIFGSDIHTDKKVIEILNKEFGKVEYGIPKTIEDICKEIWVTACHVNTNKIAEYCTEVLMNKGEYDYGK